MNILGFYGRTVEPGRGAIVHDAGASLFVDGRHRYSLQAERITRVKEDDRFPLGTIDVILANAGLNRDQIDLVAVAQSPEILSIGLQRVPQYLAPFFPRAKFHFISHHAAHAAASFFASPFERATVLSFDNGGDGFPMVLPFEGRGILFQESEKAVIGVASRAGGLKIIQSARATPMEPRRWQMGWFYQYFSMYCYRRVAPDRHAKLFGKTPTTEEEFKRESQAFSSLPGKIMGLAAHGDWRNVKMPAPFDLEDNGIDLPMLYQSEAMQKMGDNTQLLDQFRVEDVAAWFQRCFEDALVGYFRAWPFRERNLCLAGGCALNVLTNRRILDEKLFEDLFVFPGASDCGLCVGAAAHASWLHEKRVEFPVNVAALGLSYSQQQIESAFHQSGLNPLVMESEEQMIRAVVDRLESGKTVGWHQGRSEFGPRALGFRSMLADPRRADIRNHINFKIKSREWWRPLAPVVLEEEASRWFEIDRPSPYMLLSAKVRDGFKEKVSGIVHLDGTARVQTVNEKQNPLVYRLLKEFHARTNVPMLLNTSFNTDGEPIVETPVDAIKTFLRCSLDSLVMGRCVLDRKQ